MGDYTATNFYADELKRLNEKNENAKSILNTQDRLSKLNDSYRKRYAKYVEILVVLIIAYTLYLGMIMLQKSFPVIPLFLVDVVTTLLIFAVSYYLFTAYWELNSRSVINYDEIDIPPYDSSGVNVSALEEKGQIFDNSVNPIDTCVGEDCCPGSFNKETNRCPTLPPNANAFTLLEQSIAENNAKELSFNSPELKRESTMNVRPSEDATSLNYSKA